MKRLIVMCAVTLLSSAAVVNASSHSPAVSGKHVRPSNEVGFVAPAFTLDAVENLEFRKISLSDYRGKWVVLFFYPGDFTFVCPTEIKGFNKALGEFKAANTEILAASVDSKFSHMAWIKSGALDKLDFPLLSDLSKQTARAYGVLDEETSFARRGLFIIDPNGIIQYRIVHSDKVGRSVEETLRVLKALQTEELCPINWKPGEKTIKR